MRWITPTESVTIAHGDEGSDYRSHRSGAIERSRERRLPGTRETIVAALVLMAAAPDLVAQQAAQELPAQRLGRIIGIFDFDSGVPIEGAQIMDLRTHWSTLTSSSGAASLFFVDTTGSLIQVRKIGYEQHTMFVANSLRDTVPITILLKPVAYALPPIVSRARADRLPGDTVRALEVNGFYERRRTSAAPSLAFATSEKIRTLTLLADLRYVTGRSVCNGNVYIDGARVLVPDVTGRNQPVAPVIQGAPPSTAPQVIVAPPFRDGLDVLLTPDQVLAVEMYQGAEVPSKYGITGGGGCATLIWSK